VQVGDAFCPAGDAAPAAAPRFRIVRDFRHPIIERYRQFIAGNGIGIAGIEFIADAAGEIYTYDVNTNTNYNGAAEAEAACTACARSRATSAKSWAGLRLRSSAVSRCRKVRQQAARSLCCGARVRAA